MVPFPMSKRYCSPGKIQETKYEACTCACEHTNDESGDIHMGDHKHTRREMPYSAAAKVLGVLSVLMLAPPYGKPFRLHL